MIIEHGPCEYCGQPMTRHVGEDGWHYRRRKSCSTTCGNRLRLKRGAATRKRDLQVNEDTVSRVFQQICLAAQSGSSCPTNLSIAERAECGSRAVHDALRALRSRNQITTTHGSQRKITIVSGPLAGLVLVTKPPPARKRPRPIPIQLNDDLMNYGQGFGAHNIDPGDGGPLRAARPDDGLALSVAGRYL